MGYPNTTVLLSFISIPLVYIPLLASILSDPLAYAFGSPMILSQLANLSPYSVRYNITLITNCYNYHFPVNTCPHLCYAPALSFVFRVCLSRVVITDCYSIETLSDLLFLSPHGIVGHRIT